MKITLLTLTAALSFGISSAFVSRTVGTNTNARSIITRGGNADSQTIISYYCHDAASVTQLNMATIEDPIAFAKEQIANNDVMVFSKSYCPYCEATKTVFDKMDGVDATVYELDLDNENGQAIQDALLEISGQRTVPNVFVKGSHIGGNDDTQLAAKMGKIKKMLSE